MSETEAPLSINRLAETLKRDRRTITRALDGIEPDAIASNHPAWHPETARKALRQMEAKRSPKKPAGALDLKAERARLAKEQADAMARKNAVESGKLLAADDVAREWSSILKMVQAQMLSLPSRLQQKLPHLTVFDIDTIDREIRGALEEACTMPREKRAEA